MVLQNVLLPVVARFAKENMPNPTGTAALPGLTSNPDSAAAAAHSLASALVTAAANLATAAATGPMATATGSPHDGNNGIPENTGECRLLGSFALLVQLALGGLALLSLVYKRWRERPQRPLKIWFFDVSKQVFGSVLVHMANVFMSMLTSGRLSIKIDPPSTPGAAAAAAARMLMRRAGEGDGGGYVPNPCSWYLLNLAIDTTLGIPILIVLLRITTGLVSYTPLGQPPESIQSGYYGNPPRAWWWLKQSVIYFCGLFGMKVCVLIIFLMMPWISRVGDWALGWTAGNERLQIFFVMMLFPLIMNALQYYIIDSFIKEKTVATDLSLGDHGDGDDDDHLHDGERHHRHRHGAGDASYNRLSEVVDEEELVERDHPERLTKETSTRNLPREYDPDMDGDSRTVIGSSSSSSQQQSGSLLSKSLYPHE